MKHKFVLYFLICALIFIPFQQASAQCLNVLLTAATTFKVKSTKQTFAAGAVAGYREISGSKVYVAEPTMVFAVKTGKTVTTQATGKVGTLDVVGNITKVPKSVVFSGQVSVPDAARGSIPAQLTIIVDKLKKVRVIKGKQSFVELKGKISFTLF